MTGRSRRVVRLPLPGPPAPCREMPKAKDAIEAVSRYHHWLDEKAKRNALHVGLDEALSGVVPPGTKGPVTPSTLLYGGRLDAVTLDWDRRWWTARLIELSHFAISELLVNLGHGLSCGRQQFDVANALARYLGWRVHTVIQDRYRRAFIANRVSLDNRVHTVGGSEQLSRLAAAHPRGDYATLNYALAGTRADIIDLTRREMWEIKPAALASEAVLQLWAYLDNHEVARVFDSLVEDGQSMAPLVAGDPMALPKSVLEPFTVKLRGLRVPLAIHPYTVSRLPGLILYTVGFDNRNGRQAAAAAMALGRSQMNELLVVAGRSEQQRREAAIQAAQAGQYISTATVVVCAAILTRGAIGLAGAGGAGGAGGGGAVGAQVLRFTGRKVLEEAGREAAREVAKRAAAAVIVTTAGGQFELPPEAVGPSLDSGAQAGVHLAPGQ